MNHPAVRCLVPGGRFSPGFRSPPAYCGQHTGLLRPWKGQRRRTPLTISGIRPRPPFQNRSAARMRSEPRRCRAGRGSVAEWFKALVLKTSVGGTPPWVRIPPLPPGSPSRQAVPSRQRPFPVRPIGLRVPAGVPRPVGLGSSSGGGCCVPGSGDLRWTIQGCRRDSGVNFLVQGQPKSGLTGRWRASCRLEAKGRSASDGARIETAR